MKDDDIQPGPVPADVLQYWREKHLKPAFSYLDVWNEEHDFAFSAAKIMRRDVLELLQNELERAIRDGVPFAKWQKQVEPRFRAAGWWDEHEVEDPKTGELVRVNPPSRLRLIFETNMRTARAVGQYDRLWKNRRYKPYWLYLHGSPEHPRVEHVAWHGVLLPYDDPWWDTHFCPNGWGCQCNIRGVSKREADELDAEGVLGPFPLPILNDKGLPTGHVHDQRVPVIRVAPRLNLQPWINPRTGAVELIPAGIDPGFHHKPGEGRRRALSEAAEE